MISLVQRFDNSILLYIKDNMHGIIMDKSMVISTYLGNGGIIWVIIIAILMINKKYRKIGFMALGALILSTILGEEILKNIVKRIRPSEKHTIIQPFNFKAFIIFIPIRSYDVLIRSGRSISKIF